MSAWQIFSDAGNNYRWVTSCGDAATEPEESHRTLIQLEDPIPRLPSMADLLIQGSSKLSGNSGGSEESSPMFRTGLGKSVAVKQSSIMKALSVLGGDDATDRGQVCTTDKGCNFSNSLFQTGSGKTVGISSAGLIRAKTLLGLEKNSSQFAADESKCLENSPHLKERMDAQNNGDLDSRSITWHLVDGQTDLYTSECVPKKEVLPNLVGSDLCQSACKPPPVKFQTAGGRSISVSNDALQRARSLLGDSEFCALPNEGCADGPLFSFLKKNRFDDTLVNKENDPHASFLKKDPATSKYTSASFLPPKKSLSKQNQGSVTLEAFNSGVNLIKQDNANSFAHKGFHSPNSNISCMQNSSSNGHLAPHTVVEQSLAKDIGSGMTPLGRSSGGPLVDISNDIGTSFVNQKHVVNEKRKLGKRSSISPFKRPRNSWFSTPLNNNISSPHHGSTTLTSEDSSFKTKVFARYPFQVQRMTAKEFFGGPPCHQNLLEHIPDKVKCMSADSAKMYVFHDGSGLDRVGAEAFRQMLIQSGASTLYASREWVANHYKWIVWKLACYERGYPAKATGKYLTVSNVLEELKYRYEREVNHGHRSALKRILEGDASPTSMVVLCISAIHSKPDERFELERAMAPYEDANKFSGSNLAEISNSAKIELTDGWYSLDALLDVSLSKQLSAGKLFVGQKLRIWRAGLCGWVGPVAPLETSRMVSLLLHINGTYRAHWTDRLGFCKSLGPPLAFSCIKGAGGPVPMTLVGVTRIYPILYKERLTDGGSAVRSERMEAKMLQLYNQRRSTIAEGIVSEFQKDVLSSHSKNDINNEEGEKIFAILETAAEPEVLMADMSTEQLTSFASYQAKQEAIRQSDIQKKIEKALEDAGLSEREVTPFMRLRVVGLTSKCSQRKGCPREGLITIWNPTEKQQLELVEGQAYTVSGLVPLSYYDSYTIYLQARGSATTWQSLSPVAIANFEPFFSPRKSVLLSNLGEVPLASEFDIAAVVVYVGEVHISGHQKKQWVFVTDGSISASELQSGQSNCLLAISFCSPVMDNDSFAPISCTLAGSTVGFSNLVKRARDQINHIWVAEATDNSTYFFSYDLPQCSHLKEAADSAMKWTKISSLAIQKLRERVLFIVGDGES